MLFLPVFCLHPTRLWATPSSSSLCVLWSCPASFLSFFSLCFFPYPTSNRPPSLPSPHPALSLTDLMFPCCCYVVTLSFLTLCNPVDCSPPGSSAYGILQARILEWIAISFSRGSSRTRGRTCGSCICRGGSLPLSHLGRPVFPSGFGLSCELHPRVYPHSTPSSRDD